MVVVVRHGVGRAMVFSRVVVREAVNHLREEEAYRKEKAEQDHGQARATQVPHRGKITRARHGGSRLLRFSRETPGFSGRESGTAARQVTVT
jgi:hypothetical protein